MTEHTLGIRVRQFQARKEFGGHASSATGVVRAARSAGSRASRLAQRAKEVTLDPYGFKSARAHVAGLELLVNDEGAGVHVAHRVDQAHHPSGTAEIESLQRRAQRRKMKEGIAGQHVGTFS